MPQDVTGRTFRTDLSTRDFRPLMADLPPALDEHVRRWLEGNQKYGYEVCWGLFPLGMVQRWIERAEAAEAKLKQIADDEPLQVGP